MMFITPLEAMGTLSEIASAKKVTDVKNEENGTSFTDKLIDAVQKVRDLENESNQASYDLAVGNTDDLTGVMLTATKAQTAIQLTTQITTRAVNTYKEIMQMNI